MGTLDRSQPHLLPLKPRVGVGAARSGERAEEGSSPAALPLPLLPWATGNQAWKSGPALGLPDRSPGQGRKDPAQPLSPSLAGVPAPWAPRSFQGSVKETGGSLGSQPGPLGEVRDAFDVRT